jgi:hypothetical protein
MFMSTWLALVAFLFLARLVLGRQDTKEKQKRYLSISGTAVAAVMGLRYPAYEVVADLGTYVGFYERMRHTPWSSIFSVSDFGYGYVVANKLLASVVPWGQFIVIVEAAFCVFCAARFIYRNSDHAFHGMLFYVTLGAMSFQLTGFRQAIAMSICLLSLEFVKTRRPVRFAAVVLAAAAFHQTAIVFLPAYWTMRRSPSVTRSLAWIALMVAGVLGATAITALGNVLFRREYAGYVGSTYGGMVPILTYGAVVVISLWQRRRLRNWIGVNMTMIGLAIYVMRYATLVLERISFYFTQGVIVALPEAINSETDARLRTVLQIAAVSLAVALFAYRITTSEWGVYRFFWQ